MDPFSINYRESATTNRVLRDLGGLEYEVKRYSWDRYVGPSILEYEATGNVGALGNLLNYLGKGVVVTDNHRGKPVWWGRLNEMTFTDENLTVTFSLDKTSNKTACRYNYLGESGITAFVEDTDSQNSYGILEMILSKSDTSPDAALSYATSEHEFLRWPQPIINIKKSNRVFATIKAESWLYQMNQRYYNQDEGLEAFEDFGSGNQKLGDVAANETVAQSFELSSAAGWDIKKIAIRIRKEGAPVDDVQLYLMSDSGVDTPSAILATATVIGGADIPESMTRVEFTFPTAYTAAISTTYWIAVTRSGGADSTNYYVVEANEDLGADGIFRIYDGSAWNTREPDADMPYWVYGEDETSDQITDIVTEKAEFVKNITIESSGVFTNQFRNDYPVAWDEYALHMDNGTDNDLRYTGELDIDRNLDIFEEPSVATTSDPIIGADGVLCTPTGTPVPPADCYIGWVNISDLSFISSLNTEFLDLLSQFYIDESEWRNGEWHPTRARGAGKIGDSFRGILRG